MRIRRVAASALVAEAAFLGIVLASDIADPARFERSISDGVHLGGGAVVTASFVLHAVSLGALARLTPRRIAGGLWTAAAGMVLAAVFPTTPGGDGISGIMHMAGAYLAFGGVVWAAMAGPRSGALGLLHAAVPVTTLAMAAALAADAEAWKALERVQVAVNGVWLMAMVQRATLGFSSGSGSATT